jgi:hypothetical protein
VKKIPAALVTAFLLQTAGRHIEIVQFALSSRPVRRAI